ncbi:hypothetical protein N7G274_010809 [Stereocaulon virgatum]|uniref:Uncharacterized protein n=1 Tax=Stereocaulon virgatum TaxID=373712 RepID=A0ABR3ZTR7_9LECA
MKTDEQRQQDSFNQRTEDDDRLNQLQGHSIAPWSPRNPINQGLSELLAWVEEVMNYDWHTFPIALFPQGVHAHSLDG